MGIEVSAWIHLEHETKSRESTKQQTNKRTRKKQKKKGERNSNFIPLSPRLSSLPGKRRSSPGQVRVLHRLGPRRFRILSGRSRDTELKDKLGANAKTLECLGGSSQALSRCTRTCMHAAIPRRRRRRRRLSRCPPRRSRIAISPLFPRRRSRDARCLRSRAASFHRPVMYGESWR